MLRDVRYIFYGHGIIFARVLARNSSIEDANFHDASLDKHEAKCYSSLSVSCQHNGETLKAIDLFPTGAEIDRCTDAV